MKSERKEATTSRDASPRFFANQSSSLVPNDQKLKGTSEEDQLEEKDCTSLHEKTKDTEGEENARSIRGRVPLPALDSPSFS